MTFDALHARLKGDLVLPNDDGYAEGIKRWAVNSQKMAGAIAYVRDAGDVSEALRFVKEKKIDVAVRGGGHQLGGVSSSEGGLVIDLSRYLNSVKIDAEKKIACVEGGAIWVTVEEAAIKHGLATVAPREGKVGVGGYLLGAGVGVHSSAYGFSCDNIVQAQMVIADGSVLTVNENENSDLFFAIRGGCGNFGVVTEFHIQLYPQRPTVFAGPIFFPPPAVNAVAEAVDAWWAHGELGKAHIDQIITRGPDGNPVIGLDLFYNGSESEGKAQFKAFFDLNPVMDMTGEIPYMRLNNMLPQHSVAPGRCQGGNSVYFSGPQKDVTPKVFEEFVKVTKDAEVKATLLYKRYSPSRVSKVPANATAYVHRETPGVAVSLLTWENDTVVNRKSAREISACLLSVIAKAEGRDPEVGSGNIGFDMGPSRAPKVFGSNYPRLQQLKRKYDPDMIFNKWIPITPSA